MNHENMRVIIIEKSEEINAITKAIDLLYSEISSPNPYFSSLWIKIWWKHFKKNAKARILSIWDRDQKVLLAIWPLHEVKVVSGTALWPMLYNVADYFDPLIHPKNKKEVLELLLRTYLHEIKNYPYIWTLVLREDFYKNLQLHSDEIKNKQLLNTTKERLYCEIENTDFNRFLNSKLGTKSQKTLRYTKKKLLEKGKVQFLDLESPDEIETCLPILCGIEQSSWKSKEGIGIFAMPGLRAFFFELLPKLAEKREVRISVLKLEEETIAYQLGLLSKDYYGVNCLTYDNNFQQFSPGSHLMLHTLKRVFEEKRKQYDFMIGDQDYKKKFATHRSPLYSIHIFQRSIRGWLNMKTIQANINARKKAAK